MKNSIRCCISCILPCGALDVIRIVHSNGYVEEISGSIKACDVMKAHPKHVLKRPSSPTAADHDAAAASSALPKIAVVPPEAQLQRGKIYFLMPLPPNPRSRTSTRRNKKNPDNNNNNINNININNNSQRNGAVPDNAISMTNLLLSDQYLTEILSEKASTHRERRRGRVGVWRPHLESICESPTAATHI